MTEVNKNEPLLQVKHLKTYFHSNGTTVKAVNDVSFEVYQGETLGIVGESGCGKSMTCMSLARLVECPPGKYEGGEILLDGKDMLKISDEELRHMRGNKISYIFQEPMTSLNPVFKIGYQISEVLRLHRGMDKKQAWQASIEALDKVRIPNPERIVNEYPFELSGGMRQRVMIAMALACTPQLLVADEPTTALDVTIQAQVLDLMNQLKKELNTSIIFITHDLSVIAEMADRVMVMYAGKVVEIADVNTIFERPLHPYTQGLIGSRPDLHTNSKRLTVIPGNVPDLSELPEGCSFGPRCAFCEHKCQEAMPELVEVEPKHWVRCYFPGGKK
ncbi:MAG: ABC transporter ATP-binding protein [Erysipelotrichaceae bacterium]|jgi:oligopeptide/dipeptide ABC transporter ATP-binding protein|uniref:ABC transporter ATP-binding protein n=1 Tax=Grylomicrobium aquisgranensis TaxID=2926318 RepID=A0AB35U0N7_9FIRM|nr:ABC transporter ATP-binding protein [Lactimicrobium massiliense]MCH4020824.1 ABC transporter ATP-binding protein [Erysipelotrichaceae bacterium]MCI1326921.1 ABC transporter ATP-binding protein [Solobacterium sp.]MDX8419015.1 ABC transporter ATP-binding protein [Stecheria sp. CLA-KB-P133]MCH4044179.1 ABC transporter ATP-binding protein [Erysipelotrichaceae bacterium]MCH4121393.1 ABC transporter ATP-binding protein [Erysipelotrichaceae bacterium]